MKKFGLLAAMLFSFSTGETIAQKPESDDGPVDPSEETSGDDLSGAWADCGEDGTVISDDDSETDLETLPGSDQESESDDLICSGDEVIDSEPGIDQPIVGLEEQDEIDDFFSDFATEIDLQLDFSFGLLHA